MKISGSGASESRWVSRFSERLNCLHFSSRCTIFLLMLSIVSRLSSFPAAGAVDPFAVQQAIDRGVLYLKKSQNDRGGWTEYSGQSCGLSSLCTLALLNSGVPSDDAVIQNAMQYLRGFEPEETYSVALQTLTFCHLGSAGDLPRVRRNVKWLVEHQRRGDAISERGGSWDYGRQRGSGDPSNSQFALLALSAAADAGIQIDSEVFARSLAYWQVRQSQGGWSYGTSPRLSGSMTCAGIASLVIARQNLKSTGDLSIDCCGSRADQVLPIEQGIGWLGDHFTLQVNPGGDSLTFYYYLYALERVGRLTGRRFIGGHDWYREGAERLLSLQDEFTGFWSGSGAMEQNRDVATSFALLFLSKGKRQVVIGRAEYSGPLNQAALQWQRHPDGLRQLVRHVERDWGRDLSWQTVEIESGQLQDLLQAPVLIMSGSDSFQMSDLANDRLRDYVDQGGCLIFEAESGDGCGDASGFTQSVNALIEQWFPQASLERLPPSHPVWTARHRVDPSKISSDFWVYGVQACCRTAVFYVPQSVSCRWGYGDYLFHSPAEPVTTTNKQALEEVTTAIQLGENLIAYATGRELKEKLEQRIVLRGEPSLEVKRSEIRLATLALYAGASEAKRTVPNAANLISSSIPVQLVSLEQPVGFDATELEKVPFLWVHGREDFTFSPQQRDVLRRYVENGGVVIGAALCGSEEFTKAFKREWSLVLPEAGFEPVSRESTLMNLANGFDIRTVASRRFDGTRQLVKNQGLPPLEWMTYDGLAAVIFSPLDLSCALESPNSIQCPGYSTETAAKIAANIVLYCLQQ